MGRFSVAETAAFSTYVAICAVLTQRAPRLCVISKYTVEVARFVSAQIFAIRGGKGAYVHPTYRWEITHFGRRYYAF